MEKLGDSDWQLLIDLPEGEYEYKYVVDGEWVLDTKMKLLTLTETKIILSV